MRYPEVVEMLIEETTSIGVAGAHGKTSTSGLLAHVLVGSHQQVIWSEMAQVKGFLMHGSLYLKLMNIVAIL